MRVYRVLGVDPGLRRTGFGLIDVAGTRLTYVASGVIRSPEGTLPSRLKAIHDGLAEVITRYAPDLAVAEIVFVNVNPQSTLLLGQARGAAITATGLPIGLDGGTNIPRFKSSSQSSDTASADQAEQVQEMMVQRLLTMSAGKPSKDAADALACAVCHAHMQHLDAGTPVARTVRRWRAQNCGCGGCGAV